MNHAKNGAYHIIRVATAITFLWIGVLIFKEPQFWGGFLQPWAAGILPIPIEQAMIGTAILDIVVGFLLLIDAYVWVGGVIGSFHLIIVLIVSGINGITVRDIGLLGATLALFWEDFPKAWKNDVKKKLGTTASIPTDKSEKEQTE